MSSPLTFDDKVDSAVHAAFTALGLSVENHVPVADILNGYLTDIFGRLVTSDEDEGDGEPDWSPTSTANLPSSLRTEHEDRT